MNHLDKKIYYNFFLFFLLLFLIFYRSPCFLLEGTFQHDEYVFYKNSLENGFLSGLIYVYPGAGYFNFWTNISTSISSLFSFDIAKILVTYFALSAKLLIFFYIYFSKSELFLSTNQKIFAIFIILLSPPMTPEVWMTTLHSTEYFGILAFILIFDDVDKESQKKKLFSKFLIFISGISSIYAVTLTPVYFLKFFLKKTKENFYNFLSIFFAFIIQASIVINYHFLNINHTQRFQLEISKLISYIYNVIVRSFFGSTIPKKIFLETNLYTIEKFNYLILSIFFIIIIFFVFYIFKKRDLILNLIIFSLFIVSSFVMIGSLYPTFAGGRYAVVPGVILIFLIFRIFSCEKKVIIKYSCAILLSFSLIVGLIEFRHYSPLPDVLKCDYFKLDNQVLNLKYK